MRKLTDNDDADLKDIALLARRYQTAHDAVEKQLNSLRKAVLAKKIENMSVSVALAALSTSRELHQAQATAVTSAVQADLKRIEALSAALMAIDPDTRVAASLPKSPDFAAVKSDAPAANKADKATRRAALIRIRELWQESGGPKVDGVVYQSEMRAEWD